jgi:BirA family biotin operon repressor/biotin-[acetyl-CoA-carboxylase] ligase
MTMSGPRAFSSEDLQRIERGSFVESVQYYAESGSTNDVALQLAQRGASPLPLIVLSERQRDGRGRGANRWWAGEGALTFSLLIDTSGAAGQHFGRLPQPAWGLELPQRQWPMASLMAGLAVCEALEGLMPEAPLAVKWPNDVYCDERKICGVLVETSNDAPQRLIFGIGVNVNNRIDQAPSELHATAISMQDQTNHRFELIDVLLPILKGLETWCRALVERENQRLVDAWRSRCLLTGRQIRVAQTNRELEGECQGIDSEGALVIVTDEGPQRVLSGVITLADG